MSPQVVETPESILEEAKNFKKSARRRITYRDYEYYKGRLHSNGFYGHESKLANALGL